MPDYMNEFDDDFEYKNEPDDSTPDDAENAGIALKNTRLLKRFINDIITGNLDIVVKSIKTKNLLINSYKETVVSNGITFSYNGDGTYTISGQNNGNGNSVCRIFIGNKDYLKLKGTYYLIPVNAKIRMMWECNGSYSNYAGRRNITFNEETIIGSIYLEIAKGDTTIFDDEKIYLMLSTDSNATTPEQYLPNQL